MRTLFSRPITHRPAHWLALAILLLSLLPATALAHPAAAPAAQGDEGWLASYWNNTTLSGAPILTRIDPDVNFNWGLGSPAPEVGVDNFSARWTRTVQIPAAGQYRFTLNSDDGARLFVDGELVINAWYDHGPSRTFAATRTLSAGSHELRVEYYERRGAAVVRFGWQPTGGSPVAPAPTPLPPPSAKLPAGQWRGEYFNNRDLQAEVLDAARGIGFTEGGGAAEALPSLDARLLPSTERVFLDAAPAAAPRGVAPRRRIPAAQA